MFSGVNGNHTPMCARSKMPTHRPDQPGRNEYPVLITVPARSMTAPLITLSNTASHSFFADPTGRPTIAWITPGRLQRLYPALQRPAVTSGVGLVLVRVPVLSTSTGPSILWTPSRVIWPSANQSAARFNWLTIRVLPILSARNFAVASRFLDRVSDRRWLTIRRASPPGTSRLPASVITQDRKSVV